MQMIAFLTDQLAIRKAGRRSSRFALIGMVAVATLVTE
jgi:hypothetical protein